MSQTYQYGDYNRGGMLAFLFSMVTTLLFFVYVAFLHSGVDLQEIPKEEVEQKLSNEPPDVQIEGEGEDTGKMVGAGTEEGQDEQNSEDASEEEMKSDEEGNESGDQEAPESE